MAETRITSAVASDIENTITDYSVDAQSTDGPAEQPETTWTNELWAQYLGYYKTIPELRAVIDAKATWTIGKGIKANTQDTAILKHVQGMGKDTFNTILENMIRTMLIGGDAYAEIILDDDGDILNLKVLDPEVMVHVVKPNGMIKRYEQISKVKGKPKQTFKPEEIFHLMRNRVADEIHGISMVESLIQIILMKNEAMSDSKLINHRFAYPQWIFHLDTDDPTEIAAFKAKHDAARVGGENMYIPKDVVVPELMAVSQNSTINLLPWIQYLDASFYEVAQVPKIILGGSGEFTEASAKIAYLAFQQTIEEDQLFIEEQAAKQLFINIELEFPVSLENELLSDNKKDGPQNIDASETTAGAGQ